MTGGLCPIRRSGSQCDRTSDVPHFLFTGNDPADLPGRFAIFGKQVDGLGGVFTIHDDHHADNHNSATIDHHDNGSACG